MSSHKHEPTRPHARPATSSVSRVVRRYPLATLAGSGGVVIVGIVTTLFVSHWEGKPGALEKRIDSYQVHEQEETAAARHQDIDKKIEDVRELLNEADFEKLPASKQDYIRGRLQELIAYQKYAKDVKEIPDPRSVTTASALQFVNTSLASLTVPPGYQAEWNGTDAYARHSEWLEDVKALRAALEDTARAYQDLSRDASRVLETAAQANLPKRAAEVLNRAKDLPEPERDAAKLIPGSRRIPYATVFHFASVAEAYEEWQRLAERLKQLRSPPGA